MLGCLFCVAEREPNESTALLQDTEWDFILDSPYLLCYNKLDKYERWGRLKFSFESFVNESLDYASLAIQ